jgi:MFS transporter, Spinster family, sphingosine-1-phosphate transporter
VGFIKHPGAALGILTGLNVLNYLDRYVGAAVLPLIIADLHISDGQAGSLQSIFIFIYALACPVMGWLGDRGRRLPLATVGVLVFCIATFGSGLSTTFAVLLAARALVGIGEASYAIVTPSLISDLYPADRRSRALAIFYAAIPVGSALGYMLGGAIGARFGWRGAFFAAGGPGIILALSLLLLAEPPRGRYDAPRAGNAAPLSVGASLRALWARPSFVVNTVAQTIYTFSMGGLAAWIPTYFVRERGLPLERAAFLFGLCLVLAGFIGTLLGGQLGDRFAKKSPSAPFVASGVALLLSFPFVLIGVLASEPAIFWPGMFMALLLLFFNTGPLNAAMANVLPSDLRARGFAVYSVAILVLGDGPSPTIIGLASDVVGLRVPVLVAGGLLFISGLVLLAGRNTLPRDLVVAVPSSAAAS